MGNKYDITIDVERVADYFYRSRLLLLIPIKGRQWAKHQAESLSYRVEDEVLHASSGLVYFQRKSIPLRQITDVNLTQGPIARMSGIWNLAIRTAGSDGYPKVIIWGPTDAEVVRDALLSSIQRVKEIDTPSN